MIAATTRVNMLKVYKRKPTVKYSEKDLVAAVKAVKEDGVKLLVAARKCGPINNL